MTILIFEGILLCAGACVFSSAILMFAQHHGPTGKGMTKQWEFYVYHKKYLNAGRPLCQNHPPTN